MGGGEVFRVLNVAIGDASEALVKESGGDSEGSRQIRGNSKGICCIECRVT